MQDRDTQDSSSCVGRCALCAVRCALCAVRCALCVVRCAMCGVHSAVRGVHAKHTMHLGAIWAQSGRNLDAIWAAQLLHGRIGGEIRLEIELTHRRSAAAEGEGEAAHLHPCTMQAQAAPMHVAGSGCSHVRARLQPRAWEVASTCVGGCGGCSRGCGRGCCRGCKRLQPWGEEAHRGIVDTVGRQTERL